MTNKHLAQFESKVDKTSGCWLWFGATTANGYGQKRLSRAVNTLAHRLAYEHWMGAIPEGHDIDHVCGNRRCVKPEHLDAVTRAENLRRGVGIIANRQKATAARRGVPNSAEHNARISRAHTGRTLSGAHRAALRVGWLKRKVRAA